MSFTETAILAALCHFGSQATRLDTQKEHAMRQVTFTHNQRIGSAHFWSGGLWSYVYDGIVWICELNGNYLIAEYGHNLHHIEINKNCTITRTGDSTYKVGPIPLTE